MLVPDRSFLPASEPPPASAGDRLHVAPPGIDPLDPRNLELETRLPGRVVRPLGIDLERPFCLQVLELDRWDDPHAAIDAFRLAKAEEPELQLVLAAILDRAATESWQAAKEISDYAEGLDDVHLLTTYEGLGSLEVGRAAAARPHHDRGARCARASSSRPSRRSGSARPWSAVSGSRSATASTASSRPSPSRRRRGSSSWCATPGSRSRWAARAASGCASEFLVTSALERELRALADSLGAG